MAGIGDALDYDPAQDYIGTGTQRPRFVNGRPGMASPQPTAAPQQTFTARGGGQVPLQNTPDQQAYIDSKQAAGPAPRAVPEPPPTAVDSANQGIGARMGEAVGTNFSPTTRVVGRAVGRAALGIGGALIRNAGPIGDAAYETSEALPTLQDPRATGYDKAAAVSQGIGRGLSTMAGAGIGAAAGSVIPVVGTVLGGIAGGAAGYFGGNKAIQWGRNLMGSQPYQVPGIIEQARAAGRSTPAASSPAAPAPTVSATPESVPDGSAPAQRAGLPGAKSLGNGIYLMPDGSYTNMPRGGGVRLITPRGGDIASDQAIGQPFDADATRQRILAAGRVADRQQQDENEARARQQQQIGDSINSANDYDRRQVAENNARSDQVALHLAQWRGAGRDVENGIGARLAADRRDAQAAPVPNSGPTVEQEAALGATHQKQDLEDEQADTAGQQARQAATLQGLDLQNRQQLSTLRQRLTDPNATDQQRQQIGQELLYAQGKDPRADALKSAKVPVGTDQFGQPVMGEYLYDSGRQQWLTPPRQTGDGQQIGQNPDVAKEGEVRYLNGRAYRRVGDHMVPVNSQ